MRWKSECVAIVPYRPPTEVLLGLGDYSGFDGSSSMAMQSDGEESCEGPYSASGMDVGEADSEMMGMRQTPCWFPQEETEYVADAVGMEM